MNFNQFWVDINSEMFKSKSKWKISATQKDLKQFLKFIINLLKLYASIQKSTIFSFINLKRALSYKFFNFYTETEWQQILNQENYESEKKETFEVKLEKIYIYINKSLHDLKDWIHLYKNAFHLKEYKKNFI